MGGPSRSACRISRTATVAIVSPSKPYRVVRLMEVGTNATVTHSFFVSVVSHSVSSTTMSRVVLKTSLAWRASNDKTYNKGGRELQSRVAVV